MTRSVYSNILSKDFKILVESMKDKSFPDSILEEVQKGFEIKNKKSKLSPPKPKRSPRDYSDLKFNNLSKKKDYTPLILLSLGLLLGTLWVVLI